MNAPSERIKVTPEEARKIATTQYERSSAKMMSEKAGVMSKEDWISLRSKALVANGALAFEIKNDLSVSE